MYRSSIAVWSGEQWKTGWSRKRVPLGSTIIVLLFAFFLQSQPIHVHVILTISIQWWSMYMLYKLVSGVPLSKTRTSLYSTSPNFGIRKKCVMVAEALLFFSFFVALSSGKHADGWTLLSLSYLLISLSWTNPITAQAIFLLSEKSWHVSIHRILINWSLWGCGLGLTLSQILSKPWSNA